MSEALTEVLLRCGHIIKVDDGPPATTDPPQYFCPLGCGEQTAVVGETRPLARFDAADVCDDACRDEGSCSGYCAGDG